jgi:hypothetical protein
MKDLVVGATGIEPVTKFDANKTAEKMVDDDSCRWKR